MRQPVKKKDVFFFFQKKCGEGGKGCCVPFVLCLFFTLYPTTAKCQGSETFVDKIKKFFCPLMSKPVLVGRPNLSYNDCIHQPLLSELKKHYGTMLNIFFLFKKEKNSSNACNGDRQRTAFWRLEAKVNNQIRKARRLDVF